jgi:hypothetical protein
MSDYKEQASKLIDRYDLENIFLYLCIYSILNIFKYILCDVIKIKLYVAVLIKK